MNEYDFTIPLQNIAVYANATGTLYCQTQIALLGPQGEDAIVLGGAFYTAFVGIFDVENGQIGFAESTRALPGSSIRCSGPACRSTPFPGTQGPPEESAITVKTVLLVVGILLVLTSVCLGLRLCRKRAKERREAAAAQQRRGKKGYSIRDEREEEDEEELDPNLAIGT